jgi:hypothetical protein
MTQKSIEEQVEIVKTTTERVSASPEAAFEFLRSAGIFTMKDGVIYPANGLAYTPKAKNALYPKVKATVVKHQPK